jgi:uncharacterized membrane protein YfcA
MLGKVAFLFAGRRRFYPQNKPKIAAQFPETPRCTGRRVAFHGCLSVTPLFFTLLLAAISLSAGVLGSLVGVGGGIIVVPALSLLLGVDIRHAIAASIISVIATSSGAASAYVRERITNIRLAMLLEIATAAGALTGAFLAVVISGRWLFILFGVILAYTSWSMLQKKKPSAAVLPPARTSTVPSGRKSPTASPAPSSASPSAMSRARSAGSSASAAACLRSRS